MKEEIISEVNIVTAVGAQCYRIGMVINDRTIAAIRMDNVYINGDQYSHYCVYDENNALIATINCLVPCEVVYK